MSESEAKVLGYYLPSQAYIELKPGQQAYFYYGTSYYPVTPTNYQWNLQYTGVYSAIWDANKEDWLPDGVQFYVGIPPPPPPPPSAVAGYNDGSGYHPLAPGETAIYYYEGVKYRVETQVDVDWAKYSKSSPATEDRTGSIRWLYVGTQFYLNLPAVPAPNPSTSSQIWSPFQSSDTQPIFPAVYPINPACDSPGTTVHPSQALSRSEFIFLPPPPALTSTKFPEPVPENTSPQLSRQKTNQLSPEPLKKQFQCSVCKNLVPKFIKLRTHMYCVICALGKLKRNELTSTTSGVQSQWSAEEIYYLHNQLKTMLDEATQADLPADIPLPIDTLVCVGKDKPEKPGYPAHGHFVGKAAALAEDGCPNGHVLCKSCANDLNSCPVCGAFVPYLELPSGCPKFPGKCETHCASFDRACQAPGCTGGTWPKKKPKNEEAKVEEAPPQAPKKEA